MNVGQGTTVQAHARADAIFGGPYSNIIIGTRGPHSQGVPKILQIMVTVPLIFLLCEIWKSRMTRRPTN